MEAASSLLLALRSLVVDDDVSSHVSFVGILIKKEKGEKRKKVALPPDTLLLMYPRPHIEICQAMASIESLNWSATTTRSEAIVVVLFLCNPPMGVIDTGGHWNLFVSIEWKSSEIIDV